MNKQDSNVGNLGDILKHAALVSLLDLFLEDDEPIVWVDTHAYALEATCPNVPRWRREVAAELADFPDIQRYVDLQHRLDDKSTYRCSTGIVVDVARQAIRTTPILILGERDDATRRGLVAQLANEVLRAHAVLEDAEQLVQVEMPPLPYRVLALVDPFTLQQSMWAAVSAGLSRLARHALDAATILFTHDSRVVEAEWPDAPTGLIGPVAVIDRCPYHMAVYATPRLAEGARQRCVRLGWLSPCAIRISGQSTESPLLKVRGFSFLGGLDGGRLLKEIELAASNLPDDVRASQLHQRRFQERMTYLTALKHGMDISGSIDRAANIRALGPLVGRGHPAIEQLHWLRQRGNEAAHDFEPLPNEDSALEGLGVCHALARWFAKMHGVDGQDNFEVLRPSSPGASKRQEQRDDSRLRRIQSYERTTLKQAGVIEQLEAEVLGLRAASTPPPTLQSVPTIADTVPVHDVPRWVYFATPRKADRATTYELAYTDGVICCDTWKDGVAQKMPNVAQLQRGDMMLLVYGERGLYRPQLYLRVETPPVAGVPGTEVMYELPEHLAVRLQLAGYSADPRLGKLTGFRVTPCSDWEGMASPSIKKPNGQNFLRRWEEVRDVNGWQIRDGLNGANQVGTGESES